MYVLFILKSVLSSYIDMMNICYLIEENFNSGMANFHHWECG